MNQPPREFKEFSYDVRTPFGWWLVILIPLAIFVLLLTFDAKRPSQAIPMVVAIALLVAFIVKVFQWKRRYASDPHAIVLHADRAVLPKASVLGGFITVPYASIHEMNTTSHEGVHFVSIRCAKGNARLISKGFQSEQRFADCVKLLTAKWKDSRHPPKTISEAPEAMLGPKLVAREALGTVMQALKDERGIHAESLFCALGAVAGHACQESVRARAAAQGKPPDSLFVVMGGKDGNQYFFGDALNQYLAEDRFSIWSLVAGAATEAGATALPDFREIFEYVTSTAGTERFGIPRLPPEHPLRAKPIDFAVALWPRLRPLMKQHLADPRQWPVAIGLAIQLAMKQLNNVLPPDLIVKIVMESAIPVSKIPIKN